MRILSSERSYEGKETIIAKKSASGRKADEISGPISRQTVVNITSKLKSKRD